MRPLAYAACYGHASVVELLLTSGASVDATDESGGRPQLRKLKL
jgi:ankyrin repeat protein